MKKIALFTIMSLMTSVAFGQVNWGKFEKVVPAEARKVVSTVFENDRSHSICTNVARQIEMTVVNVTRDQDFGGDSALYRLNLAGNHTDAIIEVSTNDIFHPPVLWTAKVKNCFNNDF